MKPVNLLPESRRPRGGAGSNNAYWVLSILAVLVVGTFAYVYSANQVTERQTELVEVERETAGAQARGERLAAFGNFAEAKATRMASVTQLAQGRFDWERFVRELAHVMPVDSWLTEVDASTTGEDAGDGATAAGAPTAKIKGCAPSQDDVATLLVRLRRLYRAQEAVLVSSIRGKDDSARPCGRLYVFQLEVVFAPLAANQTAGRVVAALGGGQ